jgi:hypothetical protein
MAEDWIQKLASEQLRREQDWAEKTPEEVAARRAFEVAAEPFWADVQNELRRIVEAYNRALGRDELVIPTGDARRLPNSPESLEIQRGSRLGGYCDASVHSYERKLTVQYQTGQRGPEKLQIGLTHDERGIQAQVGDGSAAAAARYIFTTWAGSFGDDLPLRR